MHQPLSKNETAKRIGISLRTLNRMMRCRRDGHSMSCPPWAQVRHRVLFDIADVDEWVASQKRILFPQIGGTKR